MFSLRFQRPCTLLSHDLCHPCSYASQLESVRLRGSKTVASGSGPLHMQTNAWIPCPDM